MRTDTARAAALRAARRERSGMSGSPEASFSQSRPSFSAAQQQYEGDEVAQCDGDARLFHAQLQHQRHADREHEHPGEEEARQKLSCSAPSITSVTAQPRASMARPISSAAA